MAQTNTLLRALTRKTQYYTNLHPLKQEVQRAESQLSISIPQDLHRQFKAKAALQGTNMSELIRGYVCGFLDE